jgi:hypothetical protein
VQWQRRVFGPRIRREYRGGGALTRPPVNRAGLVPPSVRWILHRRARIQAFDGSQKRKPWGISYSSLCRLTSGRILKPDPCEPVIIGASNHASLSVGRFMEWVPAQPDFPGDQRSTRDAAKDLQRTPTSDSLRLTVQDNSPALGTHRLNEIVFRATSDWWILEWLD